MPVHLVVFSVVEVVEFGVVVVDDNVVHVCANNKPSMAEVRTPAPVAVV